MVEGVLAKAKYRWTLTGKKKAKPHGNNYMPTIDPFLEFLMQKRNPIFPLGSIITIRSSLLCLAKSIYSESTSFVTETPQHNEAQ